MIEIHFKDEAGEDHIVDDARFVTTTLNNEAFRLMLICCGRALLVTPEEFDEGVYLKITT